ncbi:MAG: hypothetical protein HQM09_11070 [Candidatus Riflebacteria bacterium]|nr:hypothetical protein [Candidatus Riflebacteria bacterium]
MEIWHLGGRNSRVSRASALAWGFLIWFILAGNVASAQELNGEQMPVSELRKTSMTFDLQVKRGAPPVGYSSKSGWPFALTRTLPPGVKIVPTSNELYFGEIPLANNPIRFLVAKSTNGDDSWDFYVDRNRDGDFTNDTPTMYPGDGTYKSAAGIDVEVDREDGTSFPFSLWIWTNLNPPSIDEKPAFNYYSRTIKGGIVQLPFPKGSRAVRLFVADTENEGRYDSHRICLDINGNGRIEDTEWFEENTCSKIEGLIICLRKIHPYGDSVTIDFGTYGQIGAPARDAEYEPASHLR